MTRTEKKIVVKSNFRCFLVALVALVVGFSAHSQIDELKDKMSKATHDSTRIRLNLELSWAFMSVNNDSAFHYAELANKLANEKNDTASIAKSHNYFGILQFRTGNPAKAIRQYWTSHNLYEKIEDWNGVSSAVNNIGIVYGELKDFPNSIEHYKRFVSIAKKVGNDLKVAKGYYNIAVTFTESRQADSARHYLSVLEKFQSEKGKEYMSVEAAKAAIFLLEEEFDKVIFHADRWDAQVGLDDFDRIEFYILKMQAYQGKKDFKTALEMAEKAEELCRKIGNTADLLRIKRRKSDILFGLGRTVDSYNELKNYNQIKDSLDNENGVVQMVELFKEYENALIEKEMMAKDRIIEQQEEKRKSSAIMWLIILTSGSIILLLSLWFLFKNRSKNVILNAQNKEITEQRAKLLSGIRYAEKIQKAILKPNVLFSPEFPESFVLNRPRDIVSGDFYWTAKVNNYLYVAVVDCTGHGVPGAMMSMVGHGMLSNIVNEGKISDPAEILTELNNQILTGLNLNSNGTMIQDGMDISLVRLDKSNSRLVFAGACQNMLVFYQGRGTEYRGTPYSIGGGEGNRKLEFETVEINYAPGTAVFLYTDGFQDQFGGNDGKKFGKQPFMELLEELSKLNLTEGEGFLSQRFNQWTSVERQLDDVLVLGFRL